MKKKQSTDVNTLLLMYINGGDSVGYAVGGEDERLAQAYGEKWRRLKGRIKRYLNFYPKKDHDISEFIEVDEKFYHQIRERFPELSETAARALWNRMAFFFR